MRRVLRHCASSIHMITVTFEIEAATGVVVRSAKPQVEVDRLSKFEPEVQIKARRMYLGLHLLCSGRYPQR